MTEPMRAYSAAQVVETPTFTPTVVPGVEGLLPACDVCGAYVARRDLHEKWHSQFTHVVEEWKS